MYSNLMHTVNKRLFLTTAKLAGSLPDLPIMKQINETTDQKALAQQTSINLMKTGL